MNQQDQLDKEDMLAFVISKKIKPSPIHPQSKKLLTDMNALLNKWTVPKNEWTEDLANFSFYEHPEFSQLKLFLFATINFVWAFVLDDHIDQHPEDIEKWVNYVRQRECPGNETLDKLFRIFIELSEDREVISELASKKVLELNINWIEKMFDCSRHSCGNNLPTDEEYIERRIEDIGAPFIFYFVQIDCGLEILPEKLDQDPNWINLYRNSSAHICMANDLFSFRKEIRCGKFKNNYVYIKMKNNNMSVQEAVDSIVEEVNQCEQMAVLSGNGLKSWNNERIDRYVEQVKLAMDGNIFWSTICSRYNHVLQK